MQKTREPLSKTEPSQKFARSETSLPTRIIVLVLTEKRKDYLILVAISFTENPICKSTSSIPSEERGIHTYSTALVKEPHEAHFFYFH